MKIFFSDVDKTLVDSPKPFSEETINAISKCRKKNIEFIMCSGRPTANLINEVDILNKANADIKYVCGFNGAQLFDIKKNEYVYQNNLSFADVEEITMLLKSYNLDYLIYKNNMIYGPNIENKHAKHEVDICKLKMHKTDDIFSSPKVLGLIDEEVAKIHFEEIKAKLNNYSVSMSMPFFLEITKKGINKGFGIIQTSKHLNVGLKDVTIFGDGGNDLDMFMLEDVKKICVQNAVEIVKEQSHEIIDSVYDNGVAKYIENYINKLI